jgi:hypothetical protein
MAVWRPDKNLHIKKAHQMWPAKGREMVMLDTLKASRDLRKAGFDETQAEALIAVVQAASALDLSHLTTKDDLAAARSETKSDLTATKADLLRAIAESNKDTLKWVIGMIMGSTLINVATMIALVKFLGH